MNLLDLVASTDDPIPWAEGDNIPWSEPGFSERMLREHLSQDHDMASRRFETIDKHVAWIHERVLSSEPSKILDLGCGPGLYTSRLAKLGHECVGIDYSPASIEYAREQASDDNLSCRYVLADVRKADYGKDFDLAMFLFGELNVFRTSHAKAILRKASGALADGGKLLLEPQTFEAVKGFGVKEQSWYSSEGGLFSDRPHICLQQNFWDPETATATGRYFIVDATTGEITRHAQSFQSYTDAQYITLLKACGFENVKHFPPATGGFDEAQQGLMIIQATRVRTTGEAMETEVLRLS